MNHFDNRANLQLMHPAAFVIACLSGIIGFGLLLAGTLLLSDSLKAHEGGGHHRVRALAELVSAFVGWAIFYDIAKNWRHRRDGRRFICAGLACLLIMGAVIYFG